MKLSDWKSLTEEDKRMFIALYGGGLNWQGIIDSLSYIDHVIERLYEIKYIKRLKRYGMKAIAEHLRYESKAEDGSTLFKVNNNLSADINHWLVRTFPELNGFLSVRNKA